MPADFVSGHFPNIYARLKELGIDITTDPIPVVPAQHYTCGGVVIDLAGRTDRPASTRSARSASRASTAPTGSPPIPSSNVSCSATRRPPTSPAHWDELAPPPPIRAWDESRVTDSDEEVVIKQNWTEIRRFMWNYVGIVRTTKRLERAQHRIRMLQDEVGDYYGHFRVTADLVELRNLLQTAELIVRSALHRKESRGLHYTLDYPKTLAKAVDTVLAP